MDKDYCSTGKRPYKTRQDAIKAKRAINKRNFIKDLRTYKCSWCYKYHNGKIKKQIIKNS